MLMMDVGHKMCWCSVWNISEKDVGLNTNIILISLSTSTNIRKLSSTLSRQHQKISVLVQPWVDSVNVSKSPP